MVVKFSSGLNSSMGKRWAEFSHGPNSLMRSRSSEFVRRLNSSIEVKWLNSALLIFFEKIIVQMHTLIMYVHSSL